MGLLASAPTGLFLVQSVHPLGRRFFCFFFVEMKHPSDASLHASDANRDGGICQLERMRFNVAQWASYAD